MAATEDDVFQDNLPVIVDCDVLEAAKENIQPLASGRRVTALSAILSTPHAHREAKLSATRTRLRINVEVALDDEEDDPLEAYCRLVYWTVENYPEGHSAESGLLELLEEATRALKDNRNGRWRGELKYLKLWMLYASFVEKSTDIYMFLIANEIGTSFALLYEECAAVLERNGRLKDADEVYVLGIARRASSLDHLKSRHREFQKRMMSAGPPPVTLPTMAPSTDSKRRTVLGTTSLAPLDPITTSSLASSPRIDVFTTTPAAPPNARLQTYVDPSDSEPEQREATGNAYPDLGTRKTRIKENVAEVKKLAGTTLKQAGKSKRAASGSGSSSAVASGSRIVAYRDPGPAAAEMPPPAVPASKKGLDAVPKTPAKNRIVPFGDDEVEDVPATPKFTPFRDESATITTPTLPAVPESVMKVKKAGMKSPAPPSEAEALRKDPLKNYGVMVPFVNEGDA